MITLKSVSMNLKKPLVSVSSLKTAFPKKKACSVVPSKKTAFPKKRKRMTTTAVAQMVPLADIHLYSLTSTDLFAFYATRSFLTVHAPLLFMYRGFFQLPWSLSAYLLLFVSVFKSLAEISYIFL